MTEGTRESAESHKPRGLWPSEWLRFLIGLVAFPAFILSGLLVYGATSHHEVLEASTRNLLPYEAGAAGVYGFVLFRWWTIPYAASFEFLYNAIEYAGSDAHVVYTYDRQHWALVFAHTAALGIVLRSLWNRATANFWGQDE
jgi:hypothetical protein